MKTFPALAGAALAASLAVCAHAAEDTPVTHPLEAACVEYELSGQMQTGTVLHCHRKHGYEQYEIRHVTLTVANITQETHEHTITIGDTIYAIDLQTNTGTRMVNPLYEQIVERMEDTDPQALGEQFIAAMGFAPTGESKTVAGISCDVYGSTQLGTTCITGDGLTLEQSIMGMNQVAIRVAIGDGGDDADYRLHENVPITDGPDLSNILNQ